MTKRTIVFDFGGVLFKTSPTEFYRRRFREQGRSQEELDYFLTTVFPKAEQSASNDGNATDLIARKVAEYPAYADDIRAYKEESLKFIQGIIPGMKEVLEELTARGDRIVGLTNWHGDTYDALPGGFPDIMKHFNQVVVSGKVRLRKPNPEIFKTAQAAYGNPDPAQVYYFDDKKDNIDAARNTVGWQAFTFKNANTVRRALALPPKPALK